MSDRALTEQDVVEIMEPNHVALCVAMDYIFASGVPGDIIEFGCYRGASTEILARAFAVMEGQYRASDVRHEIGPRKLWVFDSFEGFPEATYPADIAAPHIKAGAWRAGDPKGGTPESVKARCTKYLSPERVNVVEGWYKDTLLQIPKETKFALVHIDCDYYESTSQVLEYLFATTAISDGCTILFDDWWCNRGSPLYGEQRAWREATYKYEGSYHHSDWGSYAIQGKRFIVHRRL